MVSLKSLRSHFTTYHCVFFPTVVHSTNLFRKTGGPKCGFPVPKDGLEGPRDRVTTHLQKTSCHPNPLKSFPQAGEALGFGSAKGSATSEGVGQPQCH